MKVSQGLALAIFACAVSFASGASFVGGMWTAVALNRSTAKQHSTFAPEETTKEPRRDRREPEVEFVPATASKSLKSTVAPELELTSPPEGYSVEPQRAPIEQWTPPKVKITAL